MNITLKPDVSYAYIRNLFPYYLYDMSEYTGWAPNEVGSYDPEDANLDLLDYWSLPDHEAFLIMADDEIAGFSLIRPYPESQEEYDIGQFYVLRKFKRRGVGQQAFLKPYSNIRENGLPACCRATLEPCRSGVR